MQFIILNKRLIIPKRSSKMDNPEKQRYTKQQKNSWFKLQNKFQCILDSFRPWIILNCYINVMLEHNVSLCCWTLLEPYILTQLKSMYSPIHWQLNKLVSNHVNSDHVPSIFVSWRLKCSADYFQNLRYYCNNVNIIVVDAVDHK